MGLAIANFSKQNIVTREEILQAVHRLPRTHYAGLKLIRYDPYRTLATYLSYLQNQPSSVHTKGSYYHNWESSESTIIIYPFSSKKEFIHTLYHEIGHFVFLRVLNQDQRNKWFFDIRPREKGFVSKRANKNAREDFAETYAYFCTRPEALVRAPLKADFMRRDVFTGQALKNAAGPKS